jgi:hypothetical protein
MKIDLVVTQHSGLVEYLSELGLVDENTKVMTHASIQDIQGKNVCAALPDTMSCFYEVYTNGPWFISDELRGKEFSFQEIQKFIGSPQSLACLCESFINIPLQLPLELLDEKLNLEQIKQYVGESVTYKAVKKQGFTAFMV